MSNTLKWSLSFGFMMAMIVFFSSIYVNSLFTSLFRAGLVFIIGLFIGVIFYLVWSFIQIDLIDSLEDNQDELDELNDDKSKNIHDVDLEAEEVFDKEATN